VPPRFAYWTILIDNAPTAFRARDPQELLPTLNQLKRTNPNIVMKWFSGGTLWDSPEAARDARRRPAPPREKRSADWRPGGAHQDPRDRFKGKPRRDKPRGPQPPRGAQPPPGAQPFRAARPAGAERKPWHGKPAGRPQGQRPWRPKASGDQSRPWRDKPGAPPRGEKQWGSKPSGGSGRSSGWGGSGRSGGSSRSSGSGGSGARPWSAKPPGGDRRPSGSAQGKPAGSAQGKPWKNRPNGDRHRKRRDDEPDR